MDTPSSFTTSDNQLSNEFFFFFLKRLFHYSATSSALQVNISNLCFYSARSQGYLSVTKSSNMDATWMLNAQNRGVWFSVRGNGVFRLDLSWFLLPK